MWNKMSIMSLVLQIISLLVLLLRITDAQSSKVFHVTGYGAVADGKTDNSKAFLAAWKEACEWNRKSTIFIPAGGSFMLKPIIFSGPCVGSTMFVNRGVIKASTSSDSLGVDQWIEFKDVQRLKITGNGVFDGQGPSAWSHSNSLLPISIKFTNIMNGEITNIRSIDSKGFNIDLYRSKNINIQNIVIQSPRDSPNTDGIHISNSEQIWISNAKIGTGDDCISVGAGNRNITISNVQCGPGHGISVGSLGKYADEEDVVGLTVQSCTFTGTTNGLRIKTMPQCPSSTASGFIYRDIFMNNVHNPIVIDQNYCPNGDCKQGGSSGVQIKDISFINIHGTSTSEVAVKLVCSKKLPCENIQLRDINLKYSGSAASDSVCSNAHVVSTGTQNPPTCVHEF